VLKKGVAMAQLHKWLLLVGLMVLILTSGVDALAKKSKGISDAEAQKILTAADQQLSGLLIKTQNRQLLSPEDAGQLTQIQVQLIEILAMTKPAMALPKVLYQTALILERREQYMDAADYYDLLSTKFADSPYAAKAKLAAAQLKKNNPKVFATTASTSMP
jgi:hypothetical protein